MITVASPDSIVATISTTPALDETHKGSLTISDASGGTGTLTFSIGGAGGPFVTDTVFNDLDAGDYEVIIKDDNGCTYTQTVTVSAVPPLDGDGYR